MLILPGCRYPDQYSQVQVYRSRLCTPPAGSRGASRYELFACSNWEAVLGYLSRAVDRVDGYYALAVLSKGMVRRGWSVPAAVRAWGAAGGQDRDLGEDHWMLHTHRILLDRYGTALICTVQ